MARYAVPEIARWARLHFPAILACQPVFHGPVAFDPPNSLASVRCHLVLIFSRSPARHSNSNAKNEKRSCLRRLTVSPYGCDRIQSLERRHRRPACTRTHGRQSPFTGGRRSFRVIRSGPCRHGRHGSLRTNRAPRLCPLGKRWTPGRIRPGSLDRCRTRAERE